MKLSLPVKLGVFVVLILATALNVSCAADTVSITILHTSDLHGQMRAEKNYAGAARIAAYFEKVKCEKNNVLILDAGDSVTGSPLSTLFEGEPVFEIMSAMGYDLAAPGNHEFDYGYRKIEKYREIASFPLLCANARGPDGVLLADAPFRIIKTGGAKIGVVGVILDTAREHIIAAGNEGVKFAPQFEAVERIVSQIRPECDLLVVLSHLGYENDMVLAREVEGIDLIVGGHSGTVIEKPEELCNTFIAHAGEYGSHVGHLEIAVDLKRNRIAGLSGKLVTASDLPPPDENVAALVGKWEKRIKEKLDVKLASSARTHPEEEVKKLFEVIIKEKAGTDFAYYNLGGIREKIYEGDVTVRDIWKIEPFGNVIVKLTLKGKDIGAVLREQLDAAGAKIEPEKEYTVATNNFIAERTKDHIGKNIIRSENTHIPVRETVIEYMKRDGGKSAGEKK
ncbi:MAG: bifunctional metallophosphatase/5'-nucleotidase [Planctomycetota bacterium]|jgi:2',3'-cyclic-nucleotide 2'-phosphodiesterase (5'-nucleotidase family)